MHTSSMRQPSGDVTATDPYPTLNSSWSNLLVIHYNPRFNLVNTIDSLSALLENKALGVGVSGTKRETKNLLGFAAWYK